MNCQKWSSRSLMSCTWKNMLLSVFMLDRFWLAEIVKDVTIEPMKIHNTNALVVASHAIHTDTWVVSVGPKQRWWPLVVVRSCCSATNNSTMWQFSIQMFWNLPYLFIYKKYTILNHYYNENLFYFTLDATVRGFGLNRTVVLVHDWITVMHCWHSSEMFKNSSLH
jgi:hypothetical protein